MATVDRIVLALSTLTWARALLFGLILTGVYYVGFFNDGAQIRTATEQARSQVSELERQLKSTREAIANADRFEQEVKSTTEQFNHISEFMPERMTAVELTTILTEVSARAGLRLIKTEPKTSAEKADFYETSKLGIGLEGSYAQIASFLSYLSQTQKLLTFDRVEIAPAVSTDPEMPTLVFTGTLVGYRYLRSSAVETKGTRK